MGDNCPYYRCRVPSGFLQLSGAGVPGSVGVEAAGEGAAQHIRLRGARPGLRLGGLGRSEMGSELSEAYRPQP